KLARPRSRSLHLPRQVRLHGRPLAGDDAVDAGVAEGSVVRDLMVAQHTVQFCTQSLDSATTLVIEKMSAKFDRDATQCVKGVAEKQQLALGIDLRPLDAFPIPGSTDLQAAMVRLDIQIIRHPDGFARGVVENGKRKPRTLRLPGQPLIDEIA